MAGERAAADGQALTPLGASSPRHDRWAAQAKSGFPHAPALWWLSGRFNRTLAGHLLSVPYIGTSIFLIAIGAVLAFAVTEDTESSGFSVQTAGVVLLIVGVIALLLALLWQFIWADRMRERRRVAEAEPPPERERLPERERVVERERRFD